MPRWSSPSLFLRTFVLLLALLLGCIVVWDATLRYLHARSATSSHALQIADVMALSRNLLEHNVQPSSIVPASDQSVIRVVPRTPRDVTAPLGHTWYEDRLADELNRRLGTPRAQMKREVNGVAGIWLPFQANGQAYWLYLPDAPSSWPAPVFWLAWFGASFALALFGAWVISRLIHRPLKKLQFAASRFRAGHFEDSPLEEEAVPEELREVNAGFNRMARQIGRVRQNNAIMLAGISHDLRTPLARLRLEMELSVPSPEARRSMTADVEQIDGIIDKFLVYAQSLASDTVDPKLVPVLLLASLARESKVFDGRADIRIKYHGVPARSYVLADPVELGRVFANIFENARRYGKTPETGVARVDVAARSEHGAWHITIRDHGLGVSADHLPLLTQPFFRGDAARTAASGTGLGLAICERMVQRMNGTLRLGLPLGGGLQVTIELPEAQPPH